MKLVTSQLNRESVQTVKKLIFSQLHFNCLNKSLICNFSSKQCIGRNFLRESTINHFFGNKLDIFQTRLQTVACSILSLKSHLMDFRENRRSINQKIVQWLDFPLSSRLLLVILCASKQILVTRASAIRYATIWISLISRTFRPFYHHFEFSDGSRLLRAVNYDF